MPRTVDRKARGVGTHVWKKDEYQARKALEGWQKSSFGRGSVECRPPPGEGSAIGVGRKWSVAGAFVMLTVLPSNVREMCSKHYVASKMDVLNALNNKCAYQG